MKKKFTILVALLLVMGFGTSAQAGFVVYNDYVAWGNAVNHLSITENFESTTLLPGLSITEVGGAGIIHYGVYENIVSTAPRYQIYNYAPGMYAFGAFLDLVHPGGAGTSINMYINDTMTFIENVPNTAAGEFYGFVSDVSFTGVRFVDGGGIGAQETYYNIDLSLAPVPEPLTMLLLGLGLVGLAGVRRFK